MDLVQQRALDRSVAVAKSVCERIEQQLNFAEGLCELHPDQAARWKPMIAAARKKWGATVGTGEIAQLEPAAREIEQSLSEIGEVAKTYTMHCVGHAHIDMNWMWAWPETVAVCNDTFLTTIRLMDEFPGFTLSQSQGAIYDIVRRFNPELFEKIKEKVKAGQWEITAATWVEGDKNLANGESLARHLLYTRQFFQEHFGLGADDLPVQWEPDTFGHAQTIPAISSQGGVRCYYLCRPGEEPTPPVFYYQSPDGSRVLVNRETAWYNNTIGPHGAKKLLAFCKETGLRDWLYMYGIGDHGGGPTRRDLRRRAELNDWPIYPNLRFSTTRVFFDLLLEHADRWPTLTRELNFEFAGCYTSQSQIKKANRAGENMLAEAEVTATLANRATGRAYPTEQLKKSWQDVLFNQFHDILPGSGVPATRQHAQALFQEVQAWAGIIKTHSLRALTERIDTSFARPHGERVAPPPAHESIAFGAGAGRITTATHPGGAWRLTDNQQVSSAAHLVDGPRPVVVFNPLAWDRKDVVTVSVWDGDAAYVDTKMKDRHFVARLPDGRVLPTQQVQHGNYWDHQFLDLAVPVEVAASGYSTVVIEEVGQPLEATDEKAVRLILDKEGGWGVNRPSGRIGMENEHLLVELDRKTGGIKRLLDKATGNELANPDDPLGLLEYVVERPNPMSSWILGDDGERTFPLALESLKPAYQGPWVAGITARVKVASSVFDVTYLLRSGQRQVEIDIAGQWVERGGEEIGTPKLMIRFPLNVKNPRARYEIPFGSIERDWSDGREVPALRWVDVREGEGNIGACLVNDSKYGHSLEGTVLRQTLIRASYDPDLLPEIGQHRIKLALRPHGGDAPVSEMVRWGANFNHALICVNSDVHDGELPSVSPALVSCQGAVLSHFKLAEDGQGVIIRLQEADGHPATVRVMLDAQVLGTIQSAQRVDLLERPVGDGQDVKVSQGQVELPLRAHEVASVRVRLGS